MITESVQKVRPNINRLKDAFVWNADLSHWDPQFRIGDIIVIERQSTIFPGRWSDTQKFVVQSIDMDKGLLTLWNQELDQWDMSHWNSGLERGNLYKMITQNGEKVSARSKPSTPKTEIKNLTPVNPGEQPVKRGRGRPKGSKNKNSIKRAAPVQDDSIVTVKRGRGRPKGSKNKPKIR